MKHILSVFIILLANQSWAICRADRVEKNDDPTWLSVVKIEAPYGNCSAVIVNPRLLLTAAHCFGNTTASRLKSIKINVVSRDASSTSVSIEKANTHPSFDRGYIRKPTLEKAQFDIAYLLLKKPLTEDSRLKSRISVVKIASLNPLSVSPLPMFTSIGTGQSNLNANFSDDGKLRKLDQMNVTDDFQNKIFRAWPSKDACLCEGDSGGGLFAGNKLMAIQSAAVGTNPCGGPHSIALLVKVSEHLAWLERETAVRLIP